MAVETCRVASPLKLKPRYRGVSHQVGFFVAIVAGLISLALLLGLWLAFPYWLRGRVG